MRIKENLKIIELLFEVDTVGFLGFGFHVKTAQCEYHEIAPEALHESAVQGRRICGRVRKFPDCDTKRHAMACEVKSAHCV